MFRKKFLARRLFQYSRVKTAISYSSSKHPIPQFCESGLEKEMCLIRDFDSQVLTYQTQPFSMMVNGRRYTPDAITLEVDGVVYVEEVKPQSELDKAKVKERLREIESFLKKQGIQFRTLSEKPTNNRIYISNLWLLKRHYSSSHRFDWLPQAKRELGAISSVSLVSNWLRNRGQNVAMLFHAIAHNEINIDLKTKIEPQSEVQFV